MPNPLSADIRVRFELPFAQGLTGREIGRRFMLSTVSVSRLSQKLKRGLHLVPADNPRHKGQGVPCVFYRTDPPRPRHHALRVAGGFGRCP